MWVDAPPDTTHVDSLSVVHKCCEWYSHQGAARASLALEAGCCAIEPIMGSVELGASAIERRPTGLSPIAMRRAVGAIAGAEGTRAVHWTGAVERRYWTGAIAARDRNVGVSVNARC